MARFTGNMTEEPIKKALAKARVKYPMAGACITQDDSGATTFAFDNVPEFQIKVLNKKTDMDWAELSWNEQKEPFDMKTGPLIKFLLLRSDNSTDLVVICHHSICDGLSLAYLIRDIALFLNDADAKVEPLPLPPAMSEENFPARVSLGLVNKLVIGCMNRSWDKHKVIFSQDDYEELYKQYWRSADIGMTVFSLSAEVTAGLVSQCHTNGVTVNSALTTAFARARLDSRDRSRSHLSKALIAINMRNYFRNPAGENFGLLATGIPVTLPSSKGDFWSSARQFNGRMRDLLQNTGKILRFMVPLASIDPTLIDAVYFVAHGTLRDKTALTLKKLILTPSDKPKRALDITNIGIVDIPKDSRLKTIYFVPILSSNYEEAIGVVTIGGELNIVMLHDRSRISSETIEKFRQKVIDCIEAAVRD